MPETACLNGQDDFGGADYEEVEPGKFAVCVVIQGSG